MPLRLSALLAVFSLALPSVFAASVSITEAGAIGDGAKVNTAAIQSLVDKLAAAGGGTVVVPAGVFVSGALDLKPGVGLHLERDAVLRCSADLADFPSRRTRIEGHFEESFTPALINANGCDGLRITGEGTLDGAGRPVWDLFWTLRKTAPDEENFKNLSVPRARLALIENSKDVLVEGVAFKDSQFWNLHLYKCREVRVRGARFSVPDDYKQAPSSDGIDVDSCQGVTVESCTFSVTDDCIALKGTKGPDALDDKDSPPVERVRVRDCEFRRGHAALTLGSEATVVRDVVLENCRVTGSMPVLNLKLRPDTPQTYENIRCRNLSLEAVGGSLMTVKPWKQYADLKDRMPPRSVVRDIVLSDITGRFGSLGEIQGNPGQTEIRDIALRHVDLALKKPALKTDAFSGLVFEDVVVNGAPLSSSAAK